MVGALTKMRADRAEGEQHRIADAVRQAELTQAVLRQELEEQRGRVGRVERRLAAALARERVRDDYIGALRLHITEELPPPPPPWPAALTAAADDD